MGAFIIKQLQTLETFSFPFTELNKAWGCDKRYGMDALQRFLFFNRRALDFLNIKTSIETVGYVPHLKIITSQFAGSIPTLSPRDGMPSGDICVGGRFGEDVSELLSIIGDTLLPTYDDTLAPLNSSLLKPPLYFECCNFVDQWIKLERAHWHKFEVVQRIDRIPTNGTRWDIYALKSYDPQNILKYPNRSNKLNSYHKEFCQLLSVLHLCINEIRKPQTPTRARFAYTEKIAHLQAKYENIATISFPKEFLVHASDPVVVKDAKLIANIIIRNQRSKKRAWRIDYSQFFERYVQHIFKDIAKRTNAQVFCNRHYYITGNRPNWALHYLEPDIVLQNVNEQHIADAKYKSHMYNWDSYSKELKETFRLDLHQILAYCSFNTTPTKKAILVYPYNKFVSHQLYINSPINITNADIFLVGIPLKKNGIKDTIEQLCKLLL